MSADVDNRLVSLDLETGGTDAAKHSILSIGMVHVATGDTFYREINWPEFEVVSDAMQTHDLTLEQVRENGQKPEEAVRDAREWLEGVTGRTEKIYAVGFQVGSFDLRFLEEQMPRLREMFDYRAIDMNSVSFMRDLRMDQRLWGTKNYFDKKLGSDYTHNALDDAKYARKMLLEIADKDYE